jgi:hypothetical protein
VRTQRASMSTGDVQTQPTKEEERRREARAQSLDKRLCGPISSCRSVWSLWRPRTEPTEMPELHCECARRGQYLRYLNNNTPHAIRRAHALSILQPDKRPQLQFRAGHSVQQAHHEQPQKPQTTTRATHTRIIFLTSTAREHGGF